MVSRLSIAERWPDSVKWCSTAKVLRKPSASASMLLVNEIAEAFALLNSGPPRLACALPRSQDIVIIFFERAARLSR